ncbi:MAG: diguanylate cyclase domain-containing protein, partial [Bacillota bacterium]
MRKEMQELLEKRASFSVIFMDLDRFKSVNDDYGHARGDAYLKMFAQAVEGCYKDSASVYRMSGDEFVMIYPGGDESTVCSNIESIGFEESFEPPFLGVSVGCAHYPKDSEQLSELLHIADTNMYQIKKRRHAAQGTKFCKRMMRMNTRRKIHTVIKMSLASILTTLFAYLLGMDSPVTAGILAVLSVQLTRTDSFIFAGKRFTSALLALALASGLFLLIGYSVPVYFIFAIVFIALSFGFNIEAGVVPSLVLANRLLTAGEYSTEVLLNTIGLITLAIIVALMLNVFYPLNTKSILLKWSKAIDDLITADLKLVAKALKKEEDAKEVESRHVTLKNHLALILEDALKLDKDLLFDKKRKHIAYLRMRDSQMRRIDRMHELHGRLKGSHPYAKTIGTFIWELSQDIGYQDKATPQSKKLQSLLETFRKKPLPDTREAFEIRATLYQI